MILQSSRDEFKEYNNNKLQNKVKEYNNKLQNEINE